MDWFKLTDPTVAMEEICSYADVNLERVKGLESSESNQKLLESWTRISNTAHYNLDICKDDYWIEAGRHFLCPERCFESFFNLCKRTIKDHPEDDLSLIHI